MVTKKARNNLYCLACDYNTCKPSDFFRHKMTAKHINTENQEINDNKKTPNVFTCDCGTKYKYKTGLSRHRKNCNYQAENVIIHTDVSPNVSSVEANNIISYLMKENQDFKQMLIEQNKQMIEYMKTSNNGPSYYSNTNNTQINKQKFNLNFFLNETCKDAMNITDFVNSLQIQFSDLEKVGELGYAEGISRIFMRGLKALDVCKRPIHCTDLKREIVHIKNNNQWEKEISLLQKAIKIITNNNINKITDWKNAHPGCTDGENKLNDKYCKIMYESMGPIDEEQEQRDFSKIIRNIAKCTVIDKVNGEI